MIDLTLELLPSTYNDRPAFCVMVSRLLVTVC